MVNGQDDKSDGTRPTWTVTEGEVGRQSPQPHAIVAPYVTPQVHV